MPTPQRVLHRHVVSMALKTRHIGTCGFCQQQVKCPGGELAHHGYKRPGYGYIEGGCPGTKHPPYEVSPETAQIGLDLYTRMVTGLKRQKQRHPNTTEMWIPKRHSKELVKVVKSETDPVEWGRWHRVQGERIDADLRQNERYLKMYEKLVRDWKPAEVTTVEEEERKKRERADVVREQRMDRYTTNRDKTVDRLRKLFDKVRKNERELETARDGKRIAKALENASSAANSIYETFGGKPEKLQRNYPGPISRDEIIADWKMDDVLKHMGLIEGGKYVTIREARDMESLAFRGNSGEQYYLWKGLDVWKPFWPGWKGSIEYPEGSTGENNSRHKW